MDTTRHLFAWFVSAFILLACIVGGPTTHAGHRIRYRSMRILRRIMAGLKASPVCNRRRTTRLPRNGAGTTSLEPTVTDHPAIQTRKESFMKTISLILMAVMLTACSTFNPVPEGYTGPTAVIKDTYSNKAALTAHYFTLLKINDNYVESSFGATRSAYYGQGAYFEPVMVEREVLPESQAFTISAYVFFPTDMQMLFGNTLTVEGTVTFSPEPGESYLVKGELNETRSEVWLENSKGDLIGEKITKKHTK